MNIKMIKYSYLEDIKIIILAVLNKKRPWILHSNASRAEAANTPSGPPPVPI